MSTYTSEDVRTMFPELVAIREDGARVYQSVAISVFDHWLGLTEYQADMPSEVERDRRNKKLISHWMALFELTPIFEIDASGSPTLVTDKDSFYQHSFPWDWKTSTSFQFVVLPEFKAIYTENWDDTNLLWYKERNLVKPVLELALECGLHVLE